MQLFSNKVAKNASWIIGGKIVQSVLALVITMLTARYLGPANFGVLNYSASLVAFAVPIMQLGLNNVLVQELTLYPNDEGKIIGSSIILSLISASFCILGVYLFTFIVNFGEVETIIVSVLYSLMLIFLACELIQYWFQAKLLSKYKSIISLVAYFIVSLFKIFLLVTGKSIYWFAISYSIDFFIIAVLLIIVYKRLGGQNLRFSKDVAKRMLTKSKYYIVSGILIVIFGQLDKIMLKMMVNDTAAGIYSAAIVTVGLAAFIFTAIIDSFRPIIFDHKKAGDIISYEKNIVRLFSLVILFSLLQSVVFTIFAKFIILTLYGKEYVAASGVLQIVVWYTSFSYLGGSISIWILSENKQKFLIWINLFGALFNIILNSILIPILGIYGAAITSLLTQFFANVVMVCLIKELRHLITLYVKALNPKVLLSLFRQTFRPVK